MRKAASLILITAVALGGWTVAQRTSNAIPLHVPTSLPPNIYLILDDSGSMSCQPNGQYGGQCSNYDWGGMRFDSKISIAKSQLTYFLNMEHWRVRWSFWLYSGTSFYVRASNVGPSYSYFPSGLYRSSEPAYNTYVLAGSACSGDCDLLLEPIVHGPAGDKDQWFKSCLDPGFDNRPSFRRWLDRNFLRTTGTVDVPGLTWPFLLELGARGSTPISYSLESILEYTQGFDLTGNPSLVHYFDFATGNESDWPVPEVEADPFFLKRTNIIILITDGVDTCQGMEVAQKAAQTLLDLYGIRTFIIGFGLQSYSDKYELNRLAEAGGTEAAFFMDAPSALTKIMEIIGADKYDPIPRMH